MKYLFVLINLILLAVSAFFFADIMDKTVLKDSFFVPEIKVPANRLTDPAQQQESNSAFRQGHDIIVQRNLFKVQIESKEGSDNESSYSTEKLEPTTLSLTLWGTVTGGSELYAVIEDKKSRLQALFEEGDLIQDATIKKILKKEVILTYQGKDQVLEMETDSGKSGPIKKSVETQIPDTAMNDSQAPLIQTSPSTLGNTGDIMTQIKFRPFFSKGAPDGVMIYAIKPESVFNRVGLRNGDIVKEINGTPVASIEEASASLSGLESNPAAKITLIRGGATKEIFFNAGQSDKEQGHEEEPGEMKEEKSEDIEVEKIENADEKNKGEES
ncbi:MAG: PDZ domain-containing protein [Desulfobacula sp.]|nr:PDZ domain-containing protein [Desulfobacula sp.]